jgi:hypothetical protein
MRYMHVVTGAKEEAIAALNRPLPSGVAPSEAQETSSDFGRILAGDRGQGKTPGRNRGLDGAGKGI